MRRPRERIANETFMSGLHGLVLAISDKSLDLQKACTYILTVRMKKMPICDKMEALVFQMERKHSCSAAKMPGMSIKNDKYWIHNRKLLRLKRKENGGNASQEPFERNGYSEGT